MGQRCPPCGQDSGANLIRVLVVQVIGLLAGDRYATAEAELLDWLIAKPDGAEEGNVVGKFLDTYQP
jgi:hypothetical protein